MNEVPASRSLSTMAQARSATSPPASICSPSHWCRFCGMYSRNRQRGARRGLLESLDPASCMRSAAPVGDGPFGRQRGGAVGTRGVAVAVVVEGAHPLALLPQQVEVHFGHHVLVVEREPVGLDRPDPDLVDHDLAQPGDVSGRLPQPGRRVFGLCMRGVDFTLPRGPGSSDHLSVSPRRSRRPSSPPLAALLGRQTPALRGPGGAPPSVRTADERPVGRHILLARSFEYWRRLSALCGIGPICPPS